MRNVFVPVTSRNGNTKHVEFHLNDSNPGVVARNIAILKVISMRDFNPNDREDLDFLWDVWYNKVWPETTKERFLVVLTELLEGLPEPFVHVVISNSSVLKDLWLKWKADLGQTTCESRKIMEDINNEKTIR
jgi:hypothetical protein